MTTVPVFVAPLMTQDDKQSSTSSSSFLPPHTALHCEPIANIAVQLAGEKEWYLVSPQYSHLLRPALAVDGRAYVASHVNMANTDLAHIVPHYNVITTAGDALWVPTWTWHHVRYTTTTTTTTAKDDEDNHTTVKVALGASLFHFVPGSFVRNNPLFAVLAIPAMIREALGWQRQ